MTLCYVEDRCSTRLSKVTQVHHFIFKRHFWIVKVTRCANGRRLTTKNIKQAEVCGRVINAYLFSKHTQHRATCTCYQYLGDQREEDKLERSVECWRKTRNIRSSGEEI